MIATIHMKSGREYDLNIPDDAHKWKKALAEVVKILEQENPSGTLAFDGDGRDITIRISEIESLEVEKVEE